MINWKAAQLADEHEEELESVPPPRYLDVEPEGLEEFKEEDVILPAPVTFPTTPRRRRCGHRLCLYITITVLLAGVVHFIVASGAFNREKVAWDQCNVLAQWTPSHDRPDEYPLHSETSFSLPLSAAELSFLSQGVLQHGEFTISQDLEPHVDNAIVEVHASYHDSRALQDAVVCGTQRFKNDWGVGIFTSTWRNPYRSRQLKFYVNLHLPVATAQSPLKISRLSTNMPRFAHNLPDLAETAYFDQIVLRSDAAPIRVDSLLGNLLRIHTANSGIYGQFHAMTTLVVENNNGPINVFANLTNGDTGMATVLWMGTSNAPIKTDIALHTNTTDRTGGRFHVDVHTSNARLGVAFVDAPLNSYLDAIARTSHAPALVQMHRTFEGALEVVSSFFFRPEVTWRPRTDPTGQGRIRRVSIPTRDGESHVRGTTRWSEGGEERGKILAETSISPIRLELL